MEMYEMTHILNCGERYESGNDVHFHFHFK